MGALHGNMDSATSPSMARGILYLMRLGNGLSVDRRIYRADQLAHRFLRFAPRVCCCGAGPRRMVCSPSLAIAEPTRHRTIDCRLDAMDEL